jgi:hypothetical protein
VVAGGRGVPGGAVGAAGGMLARGGDVGLAGGGCVSVPAATGRGLEG